MCGRYYVDDETAREIEKIVRELDKKLQIDRAGDIRPSDAALVLSQREHHLTAKQMNWGFPGFQGKGLLINARAEGVLEKKTFREHRSDLVTRHVDRTRYDNTHHKHIQEVHYRVEHARYPRRKRKLP